jgi:hypothetical protein
MLGYGLVRKEHEFLDHAIGNAPLVQLHIRGMAFGIQHQLCLVQVEIDAAPLEAAGLELFHQSLHALEHRPNIRIFPAQYFIAAEHGVHVFIRHAAAGTDDRFRDAVIDHLAGRVQLHDAGEG